MSKFTYVGFGEGALRAILPIGRDGVYQLLSSIMTPWGGGYLHPLFPLHFHQTYMHVVAPISSNWCRRKVYMSKIS